MKPETVLNLKPGNDPKTICDEWLKEYKSFADKYTDTEKLVALLSERVKRACELVVERHMPDFSTSSHDEMFYSEEDLRMTAEDEMLDGDFPLGNEYDAEFAGTYFTIADLVSIQLGYYNLVSCGYYTEYNYAVLARSGFIAECNGDWLEAARCYEGVSGSKTVQEREYACRKKAKEICGQEHKSTIKEYIQCPYCRSPHIQCMDGHDRIGKEFTTEICPDIYLCLDCKETFRLDEIYERHLEITEIAWGINRMTGEKSEKVSGKKTFPCKPGNLPKVGVSNRQFTIDKVTDKSIVLSVHTAVEKYDKTWTIQNGKSLKYRPVSFDGGHYYIIKLV